MLRPDESELLQTAASNFRQFSTAGLGAHGPDDLIRLAERHGMSAKWIGIGQTRAAGFTEDGLEAVGRLARSIREGRYAGLRRADSLVMEKAVAAIVANIMALRLPGRLSAAELALADAGIVSWFDKHDTVRVHYVPCRISPYADRRFTIGPVQFIPLVHFPLHELEVKLNAAGTLEGVAAYSVQLLLDFARERDADWIARVAVPGHEPTASGDAAGLIVDVALGALQLILPLQPYEGMGRATGRLPPIKWNELYSTNGIPGCAMRNRQPGLSVSRGGLGRIVAAAEEHLVSVGRRISGFLDAASMNPALDEAWCNAALWFHQAVSEQVSTIIITKLETALEVMLHAQSGSGSKSKLVTCLDIFFDLRGATPMPELGVSAAKFVEFVVGSRSKVLHGTWSTLERDLPNASGRSLIEVDYVTHFTRTLMLRVSRAIDLFGEAGMTDRSVEDFLSWCRDNRALVSSQ